MKIKVVSILLASSLLLGGCGVDEEVKPMSSSVELPEITVTDHTEETVEEYVKPEPKYESCTLTQAKIDSALSVFDGKSYASIIETTENGVIDGSKSEQSKLYVDVDIANKIVHLISESGSEVDESLCNYLTKQTLQMKNGIWETSDRMMSAVDWDLITFEDASDVYEYLAGDISIPVNTVGYVSGDREFYDINRAVTVELSGVDDSSIRSRKTTFVFEKTANSYALSSIIVRIEYAVDNEEYYCQQSIQFMDISNTEITMPDIGDTN